MWKLPELLEGITEDKARRTIIKLWAENESLKHPPPRTTEALHILEVKGGGNAEMRQCFDVINKAFSAKRMRQ